MKKVSQLFEYVKSAKDAFGEIAVEDYEKHFEHAHALAPGLSYLSQALFIIDFRTQKFTYLSPNVQEILGYSLQESKEMGPMNFIELYHPLDAHIITHKFFVEGHEFIKAIPNLDISKVKVSFCYRLMQKDGSFKIVHQQFWHLMVDEEYNPLVIMGSSSDISDFHTKPELFCRIYSQNAKGKWNNVYERIYSLVEEIDDYGLTPKEFEIIKFVQRGLSSKEIANLTNRSEETIKSQRKSIVSKTGCQNMTEVIVLAFKNNWV